jgi:hypothetical protein
MMNGLPLRQKQGSVSWGANGGTGKRMSIVTGVENFWGGKALVPLTCPATGLNGAKLIRTPASGRLQLSRGSTPCHQA